VTPQDQKSEGNAQVIRAVGGAKLGHEGAGCQLKMAMLDILEGLPQRSKGSLASERYEAISADPVRFWRAERFAKRAAAYLASACLHPGMEHFCRTDDFFSDFACGLHIVLE